MTAVLDASVVLAVVREEPIDADAYAIVPGAYISAVNLAEVLGKLHSEGVHLKTARGILGPLDLQVAPCTSDDAIRIAALLPLTRALGLSLGDRACLALGLRLGLPVLTADKAWGRLPGDAGLPPIRLIR